MAIKFKRMNSCRRCKERYEVKADSKFSYRAKYYCDPCCKKYFPEEEKKD